MVTLSVDQVTFREPTHVGELVTFLASVNFTGTTSMEIGITVVTRNIVTQTVRHANSCFFTMVAMGDDKKPVAVPPLELQSVDQRRRDAAARKRRELRHEFAQRMKQADTVGRVSFWHRGLRSMKTWRNFASSFEDGA